MIRGETENVLVLVRRDLRLADNPALMEAQRIGKPMEIVLVWPRHGDDNWPGNVAAAWYLNNAVSLQRDLRKLHGISLAIKQGSPVEILTELAADCRYSHVVVNAGHDPPAMQDELELQQCSRELGVQCRILPANTLLPIGAVLNKEGKAFRVFSPFHRRFRERYRHAPLQVSPGKLVPASTQQMGTGIDELQREIPAEARKAAGNWQAGEQAARDCLQRFIANQLAEYGSDRHSLEISGTSRVSAWLQAGVISVRQVWDAIQQAMERDPAKVEGGLAFQRQLIWREFCCQVLDEFPQLPGEPLQEKFAAFPWDDRAELLQLWQDGRTGYPVVDAAMRQLRQKGWMPGRARMVVGSFLVKHLLQH